MQKRFNTLLAPENRGGNLRPVSGASVTVTDPNGALATIYSDNGVTVVANPLTSNATGDYEYYAADGRYTETIVKAGRDTVTISDILLEDPADSPAPTSADMASTASNKGAGLVGFSALVEYAAGTVGKWLVDLKSSIGASLIGFIQSGTGAVERTVQDKLRETVSVRDFGATADGVTDDTAAIQAALNTGCDVWIPNGTYIIDPVVSLLPVTEQKIMLGKRAVLKAKTNSADAYHVIKIIDVSDVTVEGGRIHGDRSTHTGVTGESGMGISVYNSSNVTLRDVFTKDCWGDGIYVGGTGLTGQSSNVRIDNCRSDNNRRQALTIAAVDGCVVNGGKYVNTNGVAPQAGIDIEPNPGKGAVSNVVVTNATVSGNAGCGIAVSQTITKNVKLIGNTITDNGLSGIQSGYVGEGLSVSKNVCNNNGVHGIWVYGDAAYVTRDIKVSGNTANGNGECGIYLFKNVLRFSVTDNHCYGNGTHGIHTDGTGGYPVDDGTVRGNVCSSNSQDAHNTYDNIRIDVYTHQNVVTNNICRKGTLTNKPKYGINVLANEPHQIKDNDLYTAGETANYSGVLANVTMRGNIGFKTENTVLSPSFPVDAVNIVTVTIPHGCAYTPAPKDCQLTIIDASGYVFKVDFVKIQQVTATNVVARVNVSVAASAGNVAYLALTVQRASPL